MQRIRKIKTSLRLPLAKNIVNFTQNHAITSSNSLCSNDDNLIYFLQQQHSVKENKIFHRVEPSEPSFCVRYSTNVNVSLLFKKIFAILS